MSTNEAAPRSDWPGFARPGLSAATLGCAARAAHPLAQQYRDPPRAPARPRRSPLTHGPGAGAAAGASRSPTPGRGLRSAPRRRPPDSGSDARATAPPAPPSRLPLRRRRDGDGEGAALIGRLSQRRLLLAESPEAGRGSLRQSFIGRGAETE